MERSMSTTLADAYDMIAEGFASAALALREDQHDTKALAAAAMRAQDDPSTPLEDIPFTDTPQARSEQGGCPIHGLPWAIRPAGTSKKTGEPYNAFWHCNEQNGDGSYCREKPTPAWVKAHPIRG